MSSGLTREHLNICSTVLKRLQTSEDLDEKEKHAVCAVYNWLGTVSLEFEVQDEDRSANTIDQTALKYLQAFRGFSSKSLSGSRGSRWRAAVDKAKAHATLDVDGMHPALRSYLAQVDDWDKFDIFRVKELCPNGVLKVIAMSLLDKWGLVTRLKLSPTKLENMLQAVEDHYYGNPYHNSTHAADVAQCLGSFVSLDDWSQHLTDLELLALLLSAVVHDVAHPGVTNDFHVRTKSPAAMLYNDVSVNENGHLATAFQIMSKPENNIFEHMKDEDYQYVRRLIVEIVLATDMTCHSHLLKEFAAFAAVWGNDLGKWEDSCKLIALKLILHACDLSNPARPQHISIQWADRVLNEFWEQGEREKQLGIAISPLCDKTTCDISKCQIAFLEHIVTPVYEVLKVGSFAPNTANKALEYIQSTKTHWEALTHPNGT